MSTKRKVSRPRLHPVDKDRARYYRARANKVEREDKRASGELIEVKTFNKLLANVSAAIRQKILQSDLAPHLQDELIEDLGALKKNSRFLPTG